MEAVEPDVLCIVGPVFRGPLPQPARYTRVHGQGSGVDMGVRLPWARADGPHVHVYGIILGVGRSEDVVPGNHGHRNLLETFTAIAVKFFPHCFAKF